MIQRQSFTIFSQYVISQGSRFLTVAFGILTAEEGPSLASTQKGLRLKVTSILTNRGIVLNATALETFFASHIEGPFWPVLDRLEKQGIPTNDDRMRISFFAAFMLTRIPAFRGLCAKVFGDAVVSFSKLYPNLEFLDGILRTSSGGIIQPIEPKNNILRQMGQIGTEAGKHLLTLDTHLMYSPPSEPFITSDNPFVLVQMVKDFQPPSVSATSFMKWIPLSEKLAVGFGLPGDHITFINVEALKVRKANVGLATVARQIILVSSREQLEQILSVIPKDPPDGAASFPSIVV